MAYADETYAVKVINPLDGTLLYESPPDFVGYSFGRQPMEAYDFNQDGFDDVIFGNRLMVRMIDVNSGEIFYNSTVAATLQNLFVSDFDGDNTEEVFVLTKDGGAYLVEAGTLRTQWHYDALIITPSDYDLFSVTGTIGYFGGTGAMDVAIGVNATSLVALDGRDGLPIWVNFIEDGLGLLTSADFDNDGIDSVLTLYWNYPDEPLHSYLDTFDGLEFPAPGTGPSYLPHSTYWDEDIGYSIQDSWVADLDQDGYDEVLIRYDDDNLDIWDALTGTLIKSISAGDQLDMVRFGDIDNSGNTDLAFRIDQDSIGMAEGETLNKLGYIYAPSGFEIVDYYIGNFNGLHLGDEIVVLFEKPFCFFSFGGLT